MNPFEDLLNASDRQLADESIAFATKELDLPAGVWICVGSRVVNLAHSKSDIDLLFFSEALDEFKRLDTNLNGTRVSVCAAPMQYLRDDAHRGAYGGYFAAKLFNPRVILDGGTEAEREQITAAPFQYFTPFLSFLCQSYTIAPTVENLTAMCVSVLINICPEYDAYFLKLFTSKHFASIWSRLQTQLGASMTASGIDADNPVFDYQASSGVLEVLTTYDDFYRERASRAANHWCFGVFTHDGNYDFYEHYKASSRQQVQDRGGKTSVPYREMVNFLLPKSSLPALYI